MVVGSVSLVKITGKRGEFRYGEVAEFVMLLRRPEDLTGAGMKATTRIVLMATACIVIFATAPAVAQDCRAIVRACINECSGGTGAAGTTPLVFGPERGRVKACINRCFITPCGQTPLTARLCDSTSQSICSNEFRACNNACVQSTATTQAGISSQATCGTSCCTQFKNCLLVRQCDISTITAINCSENPGAAPTTGTP
jgi:hypothetical protein